MCSLLFEFLVLIYYLITDFKYVSDGPCCAVRCAQIDEPICAINSNGEKKTFGSQCELSGLICSHGIGNYKLRQFWRYRSYNFC